MDEKAEIQAAAGKVLTAYAGYMHTWTIDLGLRKGLFAAVHASPGITDSRLAEAIGADALYTQVWCNAAYSGGLLDSSGDGYALAKHMDKLLLDPEFPMSVGGLSHVMTALRDPMAELRERFASGERIWWDQTTEEFRDAVGKSLYPFYVRFVKLALPQMPEVEAPLKAGGRYLELACGTCRGLSLLAREYPEASFVGVDGDAGTLEMARARLKEAGLTAVETVESTFEDVSFENEFDVAFINASLHEARDMPKVVRNMHRALKPGGWFVVSDLPFPETREGLRTVPAQIMAGIQYFEAQIDDQLLPMTAYAKEMEAAGFGDIKHVELTPVHAIVYGKK